MYYMKRIRKRKSAKISEAVFLGKKSDYKFDVYPLSAEIPEAAAVFIISRRKVHKSGRSSHAALCIGETESLLSELKKHKRAKCVKQNDANVVCVLANENMRSRSAVVNDITEARTFSCVHGVYEPIIRRKPDVETKAPTKPKPVKPQASVASGPAKNNTKLVRTRPKTANVELAGTVGPKNGRVAPAAGRKRVVSKSQLAEKPKPKISKAKKQLAAKAPAASKPRKRVQSSVDRDGGQHRLPKQKGAARGRAKAGTAKRTGTGKKAAA